MACECAANCKADISAKQAVYLALINSLNGSGVTSDLNQMYTYILDDVNRLRNLYKRLEEIQAIMASESSIPSQGYMSDSVKYGCMQELLKIKETLPEEAASLALILGISLPVASEDIPYGGK